VNRATELVHDAVVLLRAHGFVPTVSNGGKHVRVRWLDHGRRYTLIIPASPSDQRTRLNSRAVLRRLLRNNNGGRQPHDHDPSHPYPRT
jgi:hypothetical protein